MSPYSVIPVFCATQRQKGFQSALQADKSGILQLKFIRASAKIEEPCSKELRFLQHCSLENQWTMHSHNQ